MVRALVPVFVLALVTIAHAQPPPESSKLFEEGRQLASNGKWAEACAKFAKSLELDPAIGTQLNYADCNEKLGKVAEAWRLFDGAAEAEKMTNPTRAKFARERADALLPRVGVVVLELATPGAPMLAVSVQGRTLKVAPVIREIVAPGEVAIAVTAQHSTPFQKTEQVAAGATITIQVPAMGDAPVVTPPTGGVSDSGGGGRQKNRVLLAYGVGGAGIVMLGIGIGVGLKAKGDYNAEFDNGNCMETSSSPICNDAGYDAQNSAVSLANVGTVLGIVGVAAIAGGAVLFLTAPKDVMVAPTATSTSAGLSVMGTF